uniref:Seminal fluid protein n=1 Tax=Bursaphelenchus xylophilus TaxID=6326 RepID=A0A1I7SKD2_BURXY
MKSNLAQLTVTLSLQHKEQKEGISVEILPNEVDFVRNEVAYNEDDTFEILNDDKTNIGSSDEVSIISASGANDDQSNDVIEQQKKLDLSETASAQPVHPVETDEEFKQRKKHEVSKATVQPEYTHPQDVAEQHKEPEIPETDHQIVPDLTLAEDQHLSSAQATPDTLEELTADLLFRREESNFEVQVVVYGIVEEVGLQIKPSSTEEIIKPKLSELYPAPPEQAGQTKEVAEEHKKDDISGAVQPEQAGQPKEVLEEHKKDDIS